MEISFTLAFPPQKTAVFEKDQRFWQTEIVEMTK